MMMMTMMKGLVTVERIRKSLSQILKMDDDEDDEEDDDDNGNQGYV
jgi:hypothetical protein